MRSIAVIVLFGAALFAAPVAHAQGSKGASAKKSDKKKDEKKEDKGKAAADLGDLDLAAPDLPPLGDELDLEPLPVETIPASKEAKKDAAKAPAKDAKASAPAAKDAAPAPAPTPTPAAAPGKDEPAEDAPSIPPAQRLRFTPMVGFGYTSEPATGATAPVFGLAGLGEYFISNDMSVLLSVKDHFYRRSYVTTRPDLSQGGPARVEVDEQKISADLLFAWELLPLFGVKDQRPSLAALVGPSVRLFHNDAIRSQAGSVAVGGRAGFSPSDALDVTLNGTYAYNVFFKNPELLNAYGAPVAVSTLGGAVGLKLAPGTRFRISYDGEIVTNAASYRFFHTLAFFFDVSR